jgi:hypothetical protein
LPAHRDRGRPQVHAQTHLELAQRDRVGQTAAELVARATWPERRLRVAGVPAVTSSGLPCSFLKRGWGDGRTRLDVTRTSRIFGRVARWLLQLRCAAGLPPL